MMPRTHTTVEVLNTSPTAASRHGPAWHLMLCLIDRSSLIGARCAAIPVHSMTSMTCPLAGLYAGQLDFSAPHRAKKANTKSKALICRRILSGVTPSWPNGVAFKEVSSPHDCQSTLVFAKTLGRPLLCRHGIAWLG